jgi:hypothetical protein
MSVLPPLSHLGTTALTRRLRAFVSDLSGATTADFVIIGAAVVGLGMGSVVYVRNGSNELGANIARTLAKSEIASMLLVAAGLENPPVEETYKVTTLSDGREQRDVFVNGKLVRREITDAAGVHSWDTLITHYDEKGQRIGEDITYDDGRLVEAQFVDGKRTQQRERDLNNVHGWSEIFRLYDKDGRLQSTEVMHNNKTSYTDVYDKDGRVISRAHRNPEGTVTLMENHAHKVNEKGQLTERTIDYSDGRFLTTDYSEGRATKQKLEDRSDKHNWIEQTWTWNEKGQVDKHVVSYDDKSSWEYNHTEGRVTESIRRDSAGKVMTTEHRAYDDIGRLARLTTNGANGDMLTDELRRYDALGRLEGQSITHSDGRLQTVDFVDGNRKSQVITDPNNAHWWSKQTWQFDETNRTAGYSITYNDGREQIQTFIAGRQSEHVVRLPNGTVQESAAYSWKTDQFDRITERTIAYNDGRQSLTTYDANRPLVQTIVDTENRHWWSNQVHTYDSMHRTSNVIVNYNDGRQYEDIYVEGVHRQRIHRDAQGNVTSTQNI